MSSVVRSARALAFVGLLAAVAGAQPVYLQSTCTGPGSNYDLAFTSPVAPGSLVVVGVTVLGTTLEVLGLTDTLGHEFLPATHLQSAAFNYRTQVWFAPPLSSSGPNTVHVTLSGATDVIFYVHEYGGFAPGVVVDGARSTSGDGLQMISPEVASAGPALFFAYGVSHATASVPAGSAFTAREHCSNDLSADTVAPSAATWTAVFDQDPGAWTMALAAFRPGSADAGADAGAEVDGGVDGGAVDAGDGGLLDGGVDAGGGPYSFRATGCSTVDGAWLALTLLWTRRRSFRR